jgi:[ribosomal protein S5]-alanine N-acetyltransferase
MSSLFTLETARTISRPFEPDDAAEAFSWFSDAEVMRYIPSPPDAKLEDTVARLRRYITHQETNGFSKWVIIDRQTQRLIGDAGLYHLPDGRGIELGYRIARPHWGTGLATEVARKWIEVAPDFLDISTLFAFTHPANATSQHILQKLGFTYKRMETLYGWEAPFYELSLFPDTKAAS